MYLFECENCKHIKVSLFVENKCPYCSQKYFNKREITNEELALKLINKIKCSYVRNVDNSDFEQILIKEEGSSLPSILRIFEYACAERRMNSFFQRLRIFLDDYEKITTKNTVEYYTISSCKLRNKINESENELNETLTKIGLPNVEFDDFPEFDIKLRKVSYFDVHIIPYCMELVKLLRVFIDHIEQFTAFNNCYSDIYLNTKWKRNKFDQDKLEIIADAKLAIKKNINEIVPLDLLSDGKEELEKKLIVFWNSLYALLIVSELKETKHYTINNIPCENYLDIVNEYLKTHYKYIDKYVLAFDNIIRFDDYILLKNWNIIETLTLGSFNSKLSGSYSPAMLKLQSLIGLKEVKSAIKQIITYTKVNNKILLNLNMAFYGPPGTGKTEVARLIAEILYENKVLSTNKLVEVDRSMFVSEYFGATASKVKGIIESALNGVLFIDEAYSLADEASSSNDYGVEAINTLIKAMEDYKGRICIILAGYESKLKKMISTNPGFESRIQFHLKFSNYSREELYMIATKMINERNYTYSPNVINKIIEITDVLRKKTNFANAREIRNIVERVIMCQNIRVNDANMRLIIEQDVDEYIKKSNISINSNIQIVDNKIMTPEEKLSDLVGLQNVKKTILKIKAYAKKNKNLDSFNLHMVFYGAPGTGKTEVARLLSQILYESKSLPEAKFIETDPSGLISQYVGHTAEKTLNIIDEAMGGILYIDEAYGLTNNLSGNSYANEAITVLLKQMEDKRGNFCVILSGYRDEMEYMLKSNPGFESRVQFKIEFPNYSNEELRKIAYSMLAKKEYFINQDALELIMKIMEYEKSKPNYANARTLRNIIDKVILNQNFRNEDDDSKLIEIKDVEEYIIESKLPVDSIEMKNKTIIDIDYLKSLYNIDEKEISLKYIEQCIVLIIDDLSQSTGFIISPEGLCLTCHHCVANNNENSKVRVNFTLQNGKKISNYYRYDIIKTDKDNDLALIKIKGIDIDLDYIPLENNYYEYVSLNKIISPGYPFGGELYKNISIIEGTIASINYVGERKCVFADMFGKSGSSGSPIIDKNNNKVIGVFFGSLSKPRQAEEINCFTPIDIIWEFLCK